MADEPAPGRTVPVGGGLALACLLCGGGSFWRRYPKAATRSDQHLLLAEGEGTQPLGDLRKPPRWPGFAEVCVTCGFVHWFSSEASGRRPDEG